MRSRICILLFISLIMNIFVGTTFLTTQDYQNTLIPDSTAQWVKPALLTQFDKWGSLKAVEIQNGLAYLAAGSYGLQILNVSDPIHIREVGHIDCTTGGIAEHLWIQDNLLFLCEEIEGFSIFDISNPLFPSKLAHVNNGERTEGIFIQNDIAYIAYGASGMQIYDIRSPNRPKLLGSFNIGNYSYRLKNLVVEGDIAYLAYSQGGLQIVDVSNASNPIKLGEFKTNNTYRGIVDVAVKGQLLYYIDGYYGMGVLDISNPYHPNEKWSNNGTYTNALMVELAGDFLFMTDSNRYWIYTINGTIIPKLVGNVTTDKYFTTGRAQDIAFIEDRLYIPDPFKGLFIFDISSLTNPRQIGFYRECDDVFDYIPYNDVIFGGLGESGLYILNVSTPLNIHIISSYNITANNLLLQYPLLYVHNTTHILILDVSDLDHIQMKGALTTGYITDFFIIGNTLHTFEAVYYGTGIGMIPNSTFDIFNISDITQPKWVKSYNISAAFTDYTIIGQNIYYTAFENGVIRVDYNDPLNPVIICSYIDTSNKNKALTFKENIIYTFDYDSGIEIVDWSNPLQPSKIGVVLSSNSIKAESLLLWDTAPILFASGNEGLYSINISTPTSPSIIDYLGGNHYRELRNNGIFLFAWESKGLYMIDPGFDADDDGHPDLEEKYYPFRSINGYSWLIFEICLGSITAISIISSAFKFSKRKVLSYDDR